MDMNICKTGKEPTFRRGRSASIIDITVASTDIFHKILKWEVTEKETLSDHQRIRFEVSKLKTTIPTTARGWAERKLDTNELKSLDCSTKEKLH